MGRPLHGTLLIGFWSVISCGITISQKGRFLKMIGKGFYRKCVKSSFEQLITMQTRVGSTNG